MIRRGLAAVVVTLVIASVVAAGTYTGIVTKIDDKEVTVKYRKDKESDLEEKKFKLNKDTKFSTKEGKDDAKDSTLADAKKAVETAVESSKAKGAYARIETEGEGDKEVVVKITLVSRKK